MTAKNENRETERPAWAADLDLSPELARVSDEVLTDIVRWPSVEEYSIVRRLADAEMRVADLERLLKQAHMDYRAMLGRPGQAPDRGEPDFLIEEDGTKWRRVGPDRYQDGSSDPEFLPCREKIERSTEGKLTEVWK